MGNEGDELRGDDTGATQCLVHADGHRVQRFDDWETLGQSLGEDMQVDGAGCQFLLAYGLVPPPFTLYRDVYALGIGDRLRTGRQGAVVEDYRVEFPYFAASSRGDVAPDPARLRQLLAAAVDRSWPRGENALLMQSAGKDSTGLLVGLAECGREGAVAATYDPGYREDEAPDAQALARRFGVPHRTVRADARAELGAFLRFAERSPAMCADLALLPYLHVLECCGVSDGVVLDGLGNDVYMGYVPSRRDRFLARMALARRWPRCRGRFEPGRVGAPIAYALKTLQMNPAERSLAGSRLAPSTVRRLLPFESPFDSYFIEVDRRHRHRAPVDFRAYVRGRIFDGAETMPKGRLSAASRGARAVYPYCDAELIEHCFNLPVEARYDVTRGVNKVALRRMLEREVGTARYLRSKGSFRFDLLRFLEVNREAVRGEIDASAPLLSGVSQLGAWLMRRRGNYVHAYGLMTLFMLAAWLNRRAPAATRDLRDRSAGGRITPPFAVQL